MLVTVLPIAEARHVIRAPVAFPRKVCEFVFRRADSALERGFLDKEDETQMLNSHRDPAGDAARAGETRDQMPAAGVSPSALGETPDGDRVELPFDHALPAFPIPTLALDARPATAGLLGRALRLDIHLGAAGVMTSATFAEVLRHGWPENAEHRTLACGALVFTLHTLWRTARAAWRRFGPAEINVNIRFRHPRP